VSRRPVMASTWCSRSTPWRARAALGGSQSSLSPHAVRASGAGGFTVDDRQPRPGGSTTGVCPASPRS
jgi:hypothetical protein